MPPTLDRRRFNAALALRECGLKEVAERAGVTYHHLRYVVRGERKLSKRLASILRSFFGDHLWNWITGSIAQLDASKV